MDGGFFAGALGAGDFLLFVDDEFFEFGLAVVADVFVDGHDGSFGFQPIIASCGVVRRAGLATSICAGDPRASLLIWGASFVREQPGMAVLQRQKKLQ